MSMDLSLVPLEDLLNEVKSRTTNFVVGYTRQIDNGEPVINVFHCGESWLTMQGLCNEISQSIYKASRPHIEEEPGDL